MITDKQKLRFYNLRNTLTGAIKKRKIMEYSNKLKGQAWSKRQKSEYKNANRSSSNPKSTQTQRKSATKFRKSVDAHLQRKQIEELIQNKTIVNNDAAVYWFRDGRTKVATDSELVQTVKLRAIDPFWKEIYCIQTIVKSKVGLGKPIYVKFVAPVDLKTPENLIHYDYNNLKVNTN